MLPSYKPTVANMTECIREYPWDNKEAYAWFLSQTYYYVCHSVRLLCASAALFKQEEQHFHRRFISHMSEENSHELLALRDLQKLGYKIEDFPELAPTKTMYEIQYYKIEHIDPINLMGYILVLETMAGHDFKWLNQEVTGLYGKECAKFIRVHAEEDEDHIEKALKVVEGLSPERLTQINIAMEQSGQLYIDMLKACVIEAEKKGWKKNKAA